MNKEITLQDAINMLEEISDDIQDFTFEEFESDDDELRDMIHDRIQKAIDRYLEQATSKLDQSIFKDYPNAHYISKNKEGDWFQYIIEPIEEAGTHFPRHKYIEPQGLEKIPWQDSLLFRDKHK